MNRFYKYLKSFDRFILKHSKLLGLIFSVLALLSFGYAFWNVDITLSDIQINHSITIWLAIVGFFGLNQFLDGFIWKYILKEFSITIGLIEAVKTNWKSHFYAIVTPNRIGEIPARRMLMNKENDLKSYKSASLHYIAKPVAFMVLLIICSFIMFTTFHLFSILTFTLIPFLLSYYIFKSYRFFLKIIGFNILRVSTYCIQHIFILKVLNFDVIEFSRIAFIHSSGALIPHVFGFELFVKSVIFETFATHSDGLILFSLSLLMLWIMNIVFPSLLSLTYKMKPT